MITDQIERHEVLSPINQKRYNFREEKNVKERENLHSKKPGCDWLIQLTTLNVIG